MKTIANFAVAAAFAQTCLIASASADTVNYTADPMPAFTTKDNFFFTTASSIEFPRFDTLGGALVVRRATLTLGFMGEITYHVTNNGPTIGFALLRATHATSASGPLGPIWGPPFGSSTGGPNVPPGQTQPNVAHGSDLETKTYFFPSALTGTGSFTIDADVDLPIENINPAQFTAVYVSGFPTPPVATLAYTYRCTGDVNEDHAVNVEDLVSVIGSWGFVGFCNSTFLEFGCPTDVAPATPNGLVNVEDLLKVISYWGNCPEGP